MQNMGMPIPIVTLYKTLITPLVLHTFSLGLVTGKIVSGRASAGFKHSIFLMIITIAGVWMVMNILPKSMGFG